MAYLKLPEFRPPTNETNPNVWADTLELYCFVLQDKQLTKAQFLDFILDNSGNSASEAADDMLDEVEEDQLNENVEDEPTLGEDAIEVVEDTREKLAPDRLISKLNVYFDYTMARAEQFGAAYPFFVDGNQIRLIEPSTPLQKVYLVLLISSQLRMATRSGVNRLGHHFEALCEPIFKQLIPPAAESYFFGAGTSVATGLFTGTFYAKVIELCNRLSVSASAIFTPENAGKNNVGDGGLDWVGFQAFVDGQSAMPVFFGQCACGTNWVEKQYDAHPSKWKNFIQFHSGYLVYHFIPHSFRKADLLWHNPLNIQDVVLLDRIRLLQLLEAHGHLDELLDLYDELFTEINDNRISYFD
jgi:hypothetical protein